MPQRNHTTINTSIIKTLLARIEICSINPIRVLRESTQIRNNENLSYYHLLNRVILCLKAL